MISPQRCTTRTNCKNIQICSLFLVLCTFCTKSDPVINQVAFSLCFLIFINHSTTWSQPLGASIRPIWMPVSVSYSFWVTGPIFSMPEGKQISRP